MAGSLISKSTSLVKLIPRVKLYFASRLRFVQYLDMIADEAYKDVELRQDHVRCMFVLTLFSVSCCIALIWVLMNVSRRGDGL